MDYKFISLREIEFLLPIYKIDSGKLNFINDSSSLSITSICNNENSFVVNLDKEVNIKYPLYLKFEGDITELRYDSLYLTEDFNTKYATDDNLYIEYTKNNTVFKLWSPAALNVQVNLYKFTEVNDYSLISTHNMSENSNVWNFEIFGNLDNYFYTFTVNYHNKTETLVNPYAKACGANGHYGAIIDLSKTNPENFEEDRCKLEQKSICDAIIYEVSIRDFTIYPKTDIVNKGKYLGLTETCTFDSLLCYGLSHIIDLGVTHVQLMPVFDFSHDSVDELNPLEKYNWGYDPQNYNIPEGSYSTNPKDPYCRIKELKTLIKTLHDNNLAVTMDVVYNHVYKYEDSNIQKSYPYYFFRRNKDGSVCNGSGCGNDIASERLMVRKYILDSLKYWTSEYHIDGFRFDLMGLLDIDSMNYIYDELKKINKDIIIYGEGWNLGTNLPDDKKAIIKNNDLTPNIGYFNDFFRDLVKGNVFLTDDKGFISGKQYTEPLTIKALTGSSNIFTSPTQVINYVCCHDNHTLWDKLKFSNKNDSDEDRIAIYKLGLAMVILSQGVPFIQSGLELLRSKDCVGNSYNFPDYINWINWDMKPKYLPIFEYTRDLIRLRKSHPAFRFDNFDNLNNHLEVLDKLPLGVVGYLLKNNPNGDIWKNIIIIFNSSTKNLVLPIPSGTWTVVVNKHSANPHKLLLIENTVSVENCSFVMLYKNE